MSEGEAGGGGGLAATIDGAALPEAEARALWAEFSRYMDEHRGDTAGFAGLKGWAGVAPTFQEGRAVLVAWTKAPPKAAAAAGVGSKKGAAKGARKGARRR